MRDPSWDRPEWGHPTVVHRDSEGLRWDSTEGTEKGGKVRELTEQPIAKALENSDVLFEVSIEEKRVSQTFCGNTKQTGLGSGECEWRPGPGNRKLRMFKTQWESKFVRITGYVQGRSWIVTMEEGIESSSKGFITY